MIDEAKLKKCIEEHRFSMPFYRGSGGLPVTYIQVIRVGEGTDLWNAIEQCKVDIQPPVEDPECSRRARTDVRSSERIEAAIRYFQGEAKPLTMKEVADLCRYFLGQPQPTWKPEDFGLGPEKEELKPVTDKDRRY